MTALLLCHWAYANSPLPSMEKQTNNNPLLEKDGRAISKVFIIIQSRSILTRRFVFSEENIIGNRMR